MARVGEVSSVIAMTSATEVQIAPSLLTGDYSRLGEEVTGMAQAGADRIHWDVMDGVFVPNLTFGPDVVASNRPLSTISFEAHLMVVEPDRLLARWAEAGCQRVIVHAEACSHLHRTLGAAGELGMRAGVALNPATGPEAVAHVLDLIDLVLVMTVNPGFGGQSYLPSMEAKVQAVAEMVATGDHEVQVEVDGGISAQTIAGAWRAGARAFVSGSALYRHPGGRRAAIAELQAAALQTAALQAGVQPAQPAQPAGPTQPAGTTQPARAAHPAQLDPCPSHQKSVQSERGNRISR